MSQEALPKNEPVFRALVEKSVYGILLIKQDGTIVYANPFTENLLGYRIEEICGRNAFSMVHPEDRAEISGVFKRLLEEPGGFTRKIFRCQQSGGSWGWIEGTFHNCLDDREVEAFIGTYQDVTERKEDEERIRQRAEYHRMVVEQATEGIFITDQQGYYKEVNIAGCAMSGYSREELQGKSIEDLAPDEDRKAVREGVEELLEGLIRRTPWSIKRKDGTLLPIELSVGLLSNGDLLGIARDISVSLQQEEEHAHILKREQDARAEAETAHAYLETIFETITDGVIVCDKTGRILHTNGAIRDFIGSSAELEEDALPVLAATLPDRLIPRDTRGNMLPFENWPITRILKGERLSGQNTLDILFCDQEGIPHFFNASGAPILDGQGQITGGVLALRDVTKRRRLEQRLQYSELKLRSLVEANVLGVAVFNTKGRVLEVNDFLAQMLGYSKDELLAEDFHWQNLTPAELRTLEVQAFEKLIETGVLLSRERTYLRRDGTRFPALIAATMIDQEEKVAMVVVLDTSDRKAAEQRKHEFMSMVSHELRTPLTGIVGFIDLAQLLIRQLEKNALPEQEEQIGQITWMLQQAEQHAAVETRLVDALLDVARMERHIFKLSLRKRNLVEVVREVTIAQRQIASTRLIELVLPEQKQISVIIDADRIQQVIINYLTNALKYAPEEQAITIGLEREETAARVYVQDQGPGLTSSQQKQVWERFYQSDSANGHGVERGGLGLGLYIAKVLVEQHYGQVGVTSQPGEGATFWFTIPYVS
jgi:PAS domain S-box-containing protein